MAIRQVRRVRQAPLAGALERWSLSRPILVIETATSWIYRVEQEDRSPAALKLLRPHAEEEERRGSQLLRWYDGRGAAKVFALASDAVLMEWIEGGSLGELVHADRDGEATSLLCEVVSQLHASRSAELPSLQPLGERFGALFGTDLTAWPQEAVPSVVRAIGIAEEVLSEPGPVVPLHGDLHHDNILFAGDRWLAIDPKGLIGNAAYEYANSFQNPVGAERLVLSLSRVERHADALATRTDIPRASLLRWATAHTALSGAWHVQDGRVPAHQAAMLNLLLRALAPQ